MEVAASCGLRNGIMYAVLATLLGLGIFAGHSWKQSWKTSTGESAFPMKQIVFIFVITVWMVLPVLFRASAISQFKGYQADIRQLQDDFNMTKLAAIGTVCDWNVGSLDSNSGMVLSGIGLLGSEKGASKQR